ncbi:hypothetical protein [Streptomyces chartreusis]|uniref:hypothetical protein n=1 Tax=Streptomyces chartreusis TaxID=1969 RepID=UPI003688F28F
MLQRQCHSADRWAGKQSAGQKLHAARSTEEGAAMIGTGLVLWFRHLAPHTWRIGVTFVHDGLLVAVSLVLAGRIWMSSGGRAAWIGMRTGTVSVPLAARRHLFWKTAEQKNDLPPADILKRRGIGLRAGVGASSPQFLSYFGWW